MNQPSMMRYGPWPPSKPIALMLGCKSFFTGRPCKRGHICPRKTTGAICLDCKKEASLSPANKAKAVLRNAAWQTDPANLDRQRAKQARYRESHRDQRNGKKREVREFERFMGRMLAGDLP